MNIFQCWILTLTSSFLILGTANQSDENLFLEFFLKYLKLSLCVKQIICCKDLRKRFLGDLQIYNLLSSSFKRTTRKKKSINLPHPTLYQPFSKTFRNNLFNSSNEKKKSQRAKVNVKIKLKFKSAHTMYAEHLHIITPFTSSKHFTL